MTHSPKVDPLIQALPAVRAYQGKTIVIKYGGNAMTEEKLKQSFAQDIVQLKLLGMHPIVVHGGGPQIDKALQQLGKVGRFIQGMRVTDRETMTVVEWVLVGQVQQEIVTLINQVGGQAVGLTGKDGQLILAKKLLVDGQDNPAKQLDIGYVGEVSAVNLRVIDALHDKDFIPVISPISADQAGDTYNINADLVAGKLAEALKAEKLIMMTNTPGVLDKQGALLTHLNAHQIDQLIADGTLSGGMLPKIASALDAAKNGVPAVHIIDGRVEHALLLTVLQQQMLGTLISAKG